MDSPETVARQITEPIRITLNTTGHYTWLTIAIAAALRARDEAHAEVVKAARKLVKAADVVPSHGGYSFVPSGVHAVDLGHLYAALAALTPKEATEKAEKSDETGLELDYQQ